MVNTVNNNQSVNKAFSNLLQNHPALKGATAADSTAAAKRLYVNSRGDVRQSSNAISHAFRQLLGKTVGLQAMTHALTQQVGEQEARRLFENLCETGGNLQTMNDIDSVLAGKKFATWDPEENATNEYVDLQSGDLIDKFENLEVKDFDDDAVKMMDSWQYHKGLEHDKKIESGVANVKFEKADPQDPLDSPSTTEALNHMFEQSNDVDVTEDGAVEAQMIDIDEDDMSQEYLNMSRSQRQNFEQSVTNSLGMTNLDNND